MRGTDVHPYYQRGLNWKAAPDIHFVWVKVSDGGAAYSTVQQGVKYVPDTHVAGAKATGLPVGGYHYAQLIPGPEAQADVLLAQVRRLGATGVAPMLDLEAPFRPDAAARTFGISFCKRVAAAGIRPAVYMSSSFAALLRPDLWDVPGLVIVIARYGARPEAPGSGRYTGRYDVHQYSSSSALPGSAGAVDLDESYTNAHLTTTTTEVSDMDGNQDQLLREIHVALTGSAAPIYPRADYVPVSGFVQRIDKNVAALQGAVTGLSQAVAAAAQNPGITADSIEQMVRDAVQQSITITGDVHIGPAVAAEVAPATQAE